ncbi:MAG: hypothetical protein F6K50_15900 [Moorea sp. SIO3I7]|uniref:hypothetical protein n=1 Tax=Moorena sp. SIO4A1 TaxID=2607835 RepID=UPI0013C1321E|nr:hypothetical protein [Moorena sp. SIO4A1]NEN96960.1 hypothetical protein [Moorena sp. SIO3I7]NEO04408.1 hypothetical protein [Moorena sp. SIO3I8]NEQ59912.1 hypothetical protein [Moorena sp. SIO4A1]
MVSGQRSAISGQWSVVSGQPLAFGTSTSVAPQLAWHRLLACVTHKLFGVAWA